MPALVELKTAEVLDRLERFRHPDAAGEWVFLREALGIDALAIRCWQGNRPPYFERVGYEVKVSRSDFRREIRHPEKRAYAMSIVDRFYFACPAGLILPHETPEDCGLVWVYEGRTRVQQKAPRLETRGLKRRELAALLRYQLNPAALRSLKARAARADEVERLYRERAEEAHEAAEAAYGALARLAGHLVQEGTVWRGPWPPRRHYDFAARAYLDPVPGVEVVVSEVNRYDDGSAGLVFRRRSDIGLGLPRWQGREHSELGQFLSRYEATGDRVGLPTDAHDVDATADRL